MDNGKDVCVCCDPSSQEINWIGSESKGKQYKVQPLPFRRCIKCAGCGKVVCEHCMKAFIKKQADEKSNDPWVDGHIDFLASDEPCRVIPESESHCCSMGAHCKERILKLRERISAIQETQQGKALGTHMDGMLHFHSHNVLVAPSRLYVHALSVSEMQTSAGEKEEREDGERDSLSLSLDPSSVVRGGEKPNGKLGLSRLADTEPSGGQFYYPSFAWNDS